MTSSRTNARVAALEARAPRPKDKFDLSTFTVDQLLELERYLERQQAGETVDFEELSIGIRAKLDPDGTYAAASSATNSAGLKPGEKEI